MSVLEDRYRSLLRLLPASYRAVGEEDMVTTWWRFRLILQVTVPGA